MADKKWKEMSSQEKWDDLVRRKKVEVKPIRRKQTNGKYAEIREPVLGGLNKEMFFERQRKYDVLQQNIKKAGGAKAYYEGLGLETSSDYLNLTAVNKKIEENEGKKLNVYDKSALIKASTPFLESVIKKIGKIGRRKRQEIMATLFVVPSTTRGMTPEEKQLKKLQKRKEREATKLREIDEQIKKATKKVSA